VASLSAVWLDERNDDAVGARVAAAARGIAAQLG
jgi:hypothetical protein